MNQFSQEAKKFSRVSKKAQPSSFFVAFARILKIRESSILIVVVGMIVFFSVMSRGRYLTVNNMLSILRQISQIGIIAVPLTILVISQEFDLSVGSISSFCPVIAGLLVKEMGFSIWMAAPIGIALAVVLGTMNGVITTKLGITAFIATLATMMIIRGIAFLFTHGRPVGHLPPSSFYPIFGGDLWGTIPMASIWFVVITVCFWVLLEHTAYGNKVCATGGNREAARMLGINTDRVKIVNFILVAVFSAFAGFIVLSDVGQISPMRGKLLPFEAIAAVVIGGTFLFGGYGTIVGTFLGAFIMGGVRNGLMFLGLIGYWPDAFLGAVIVVAAATSIYMRKRGRT